MTLYMEHNERYLHGGRNGLDVFDLRGQQIIGILDPSRPITITPAGIMAAGHRWGHAGVRAYMKHQMNNGWTSERTGGRDSRYVQGL